MNRSVRVLWLQCFLGMTLFAQAEPPLRASIIGGINPQASPSYFRTMRSMPVQRFLLALARQPLEVSKAQGMLEGHPNALKDLRTLNLIRLEGDRYHLNFALYTLEDQRHIRKVVAPYAESLAQALVAQKAEFQALFATYAVPGVDSRDLAFLLLGCVSLDWDGLDLTAEQGCRATTGQHPDGVYVPHAEEAGPLSLRGLYWGSRTQREGNAWFTTFGDDEGPRLTPPGDFAGPMLDILLALRESPKSLESLSRHPGLRPEEVAALLPILQAYGWVEARSGVYRIRIPVLSRGDEPLVQRTRLLGREVTSAWLRQHYAALKSELGDLSYMRSGVPYEEGFTMIWHYLFGQTNERLVTLGLFADPYASSRAFKGALPMVAGWKIEQ